jgi:phospholipid/cholesterol/gamma-HCH transport system permease protein
LRYFFYSLFVVGLTGLFTGAVLALQSYNGLSRLNVESSIPTLIILSITRELGPVLSGLMCAGRVSGAIAAEIGSMRVSNQILAMQLLSVNPLRFLIAPRLWAGVISLPALTIVANIIGVLGGHLVCTTVLGFSSFSYIDNILRFFKASDLYCGLIKATAFGFIIIITGSYCGYRARGGSQGVGRSATNAVVLSSVLILISNYLLTALLF